MRAMNDDLRARVTDVLPGLRRDLEDLVRIESVSADPARAGEVRRSAEAVRDLFAAEGFDAEIVSEAGGAPAVVAHKRSTDPDARTVLLYAHHDVQPENDHADWDSAPFEPTERDGRLYGRGAADDKAGIVAHLGAARIFGDDLPVHLTVFVEGEEEVGSESLVPFLAAHRDRLTADVIVIADSTNWDVGVPALTTSLRGLVRATVEVRTLTHAVHSGMWGGLVPDALIALSRLIATPPRRPRQRRGRGPAQRTGRRRRLPRGPAPRRVRRRPRRRLDRQRLRRRAALDQAGAVDHRARRAPGRRLLQHPGPGRPRPDLAAARARRHHGQRRRAAPRALRAAHARGAPS